MPIYTYACPDEAHARWTEFRDTHKGTQTSEAPCTTCGQVGARVPSTGMRPIFRGTGWTPTFRPNQRGNK